MRPVPPVLRCLFLIAITLPALAGCRQPPESMPEEATAPLLIISIDGFRHDYFSHFDSPAMDRLIAGGLKADSLHHVFPTKTFPTHYSVVTGLHPGTHGIVANSMWDPERDARFSLGDREAVGDGYWYRAGEPIWVTAERQGLTAATFFWPGSEARIHRIRPSHWKPYDGRVPHAERVGQILDWLDLPADERPDLLTLYFSSVDSAGHRHGPLSDEALAAAADVDHHLGVLLDGLEERELLDDINIVLVSDHGMRAIDRERYILLDDHLDLARVRVSDWGPAAQIWATGMNAEDIVASLRRAHPRLRVWARGNIPARYHFDDHHRVPDVLAEADPGWMISSSDYLDDRDPPAGMHGWDPADGDMHGIFVAHGPAFTAGSRAPALRSVDLYALMNELLGTRPAEHQGSLAPLAPYLEAGQPGDYRVRHFDCEAGAVEARIAPAHLALHFGRAIHVLDREGDSSEFSAVDRAFRIDGATAAGRIDDTDLGRCRETGPGD